MKVKTFGSKVNAINMPARYLKLSNLEVLFCFRGKAADYVGDNGDAGDTGLEIVDHLLKLGARDQIPIIEIQTHMPL